MDADRVRRTWVLGLAPVATALAFYLPLGGQGDGFVLPKEAALAVAAAAAAWFAPALRRLDRIDGVLLGYFGWGLVSLAVRGRAAGFAAAWLVPELGAALLFLASRAVDQQGRAAIVDALVVAGTLVAIGALVEALDVGAPWSAYGRPGSTLGNRDAMGAYAAMSLLLAAGRTVQRPGVLRAASVALLTTAVMLSRCRAAWLALLACAPVGIAAIARARREGAGRGGLVAAGAVAAGLACAALVPWPGLFWTDPAPIRSSAARLVDIATGAGAARIRQQRLGIAVVAGNPVLGVGPRQWSDAAARLAHRVPGLHAAPFPPSVGFGSDVIQVAAESGLPALALGLALGCGILARARRAPATTGRGPLVALCFLAALTILETPLRRPEMLAAAAVLAGAVCPRADSGESPPAWARPLGLALGSALVVLAVARLHAAASAGDDPVAALRTARWLPERGRAAEALHRLIARGHCREAEAPLAAALAATPHHPGLCRLAATCALAAGDRARARAELTLARGIEPHDAAVRRELVEVELGHGAFFPDDRRAFGAALVETARRAGLEAGIPPTVLLGLAYADSRFTLRGPEGAAPAWIRLRTWRAPQSPLAASTLLGLPVSAIIDDPRVGLRAAAVLLADLARHAGVGAGAAPEAWRPVLERWNATGDPEADRLYADQVMKLAGPGFAGRADGELPIDVPGIPGGVDSAALEVTRPPEVEGAAFARFIPAVASTHGATAGARPVRYIVLHTMENDLPTVVHLFRRDGTPVGAHYLVRASDGLVVQMVDERAVAFHDACFNALSIGIEYEGYAAAGDVWFGDALYAASARLVRDVARRHAVPLDRVHVLGHGESPGCSAHTDPGPLWDWDRFMRLVAGPG